MYTDERRCLHDDQKGYPENGDNLQVQKLLLIPPLTVRIDR